MNKLYFLAGVVTGVFLGKYVDKKLNADRGVITLVEAEEGEPDRVVEEEVDDEVYITASEYSRTHTDERRDDYEELVSELEYYQDAPNTPKRAQPYVICAYEFANTKPEYDKVLVTYYMEDQILVEDGSEDPLEIDKYVGEDALLRFGDINCDERYPAIPIDDDDTVYVRNDILEIDYEVNRIDECFSERVLGIPMEEWEGPHYD